MLTIFSFDHNEIKLYCLVFIFIPTVNHPPWQQQLFRFFLFILIIFQQEQQVNYMHYQLEGC